MMKWFFPALIGLGAALLASCSLTLFDYSNIVSKRYALVYGVTIYDALNPAGTYPNLNYPDADARQVATMLASEGYSVTSRWVDRNAEEWVNGADTGYNLKTNDTGGSVSPSKSNIASDISALAASVGSNDVVVFYFSGHGMQITGAPSPVEYIVPEGGVVGGYGVPTSSISDSELGAMIAPFSTGRRVVILDTCNSGGFIGNTLEADSIPPASNGSSGGISAQTLAQALANYFSFPSTTSGISPYGGAMVLSAAGRDESCYEAFSPYNHGVMTYYLLEAPQSGDLNRDGHVTVAEALSLVKAGIDTVWNPDNPGYTFEPRISGGPVDFVLW